MIMEIKEPIVSVADTPILLELLNTIISQMKHNTYLCDEKPME